MAKIWKDYKLQDGQIVKALYNSCLFCKYCTDLFYDWGGVYLTVCKKQKDIVRGAHGKCKAFKNE